MNEELTEQRIVTGAETNSETLFHLLCLGS